MEDAKVPYGATASSSTTCMSYILITPFQMLLQFIEIDTPHFSRVAPKNI
jgi:hypothetical protein